MSDPESIRQQPARRFDADGPSNIADPVINEVRVELDVNDGQSRLAMLALPQDLEALAVGFLIGEGICRSTSDLSEVAIADHVIHARGDFDAAALERLAQRWTWGSGCGGGGTSRDLDKPAWESVRGELAVPADVVTRLMKRFAQELTLWKETGGVHACGLVREQELVLVAEDVGRHNAFDKVMGKAALAGIDVGETMVITTGRLSAEIVSKAVACRVPILASRCAVTGLAVDLAKRFGVTLVGFARAGRLNVYTGYQRIT